MESAETGAVLQDRLVHRLDRHASGALVVALTADAAAWLSAAFRAHSAHMSGTGSLPSDQSGRLHHFQTSTGGTRGSVADQDRKKVSNNERLIVF